MTSFLKLASKTKNAKKYKLKWRIIRHESNHFIAFSLSHCKGLMLLPDQTKLNVAIEQIRWIYWVVTWNSQNCFVDFCKSLIHICQNMDFSKLLHGFVLCFSRPLPNKTKLKFDQDLKAIWSFCFVIKLMNESKYKMLWVHCVFAMFYRYLLESHW